MPKTYRKYRGGSRTPRSSGDHPVKNHQVTFIGSVHRGIHRVDVHQVEHLNLHGFKREEIKRKVHHLKCLPYSKKNATQKL